MSASTSALWLDYQPGTSLPQADPDTESRSAEVAQTGPHGRPAADRLPADPDRAALLLVVDADAVVHRGGLDAAIEEPPRPVGVLAPDQRHGPVRRRRAVEPELVVSAVDGGQVVVG